MDGIMGKHEIMYATTTSLMKGLRKWQASSTIDVMKRYWKLKKSRVEEFGSLEWKSNFNDCIKSNAIVDVINSQSLHHNIEKD